MSKRIVIGLLTTLITVATFAEPGDRLFPRIPFPKPERPTLAAAGSNGRAVVKFVEGSGVRLSGARFVQDPQAATDRFTRLGIAPEDVTARIQVANAMLESQNVRAERLFTRTEPELDAYRTIGETSSGRELGDQNLVFILTFPAANEAMPDVLEQLNALQLVEFATPWVKLVAEHSDVRPPRPDNAGQPQLPTPTPNAKTILVRIDTDNLADAIDLASAELGAGDVIRIDSPCLTSSEPCHLDYDPTTRLAIENAVANGRIVVDGTSSNDGGPSTGGAVDGNPLDTPNTNPARNVGVAATAEAGTGPAPGDWGGIRFKAGMSTQSTFTNVTIAYATTGLHFDGVGGTFSNITISSSKSEGVKVNGTGIVPALSTTTIKDGAGTGAGNGVSLTAGGGVALSSSTITNNTGYALIVDPVIGAMTLTNVIVTSNTAGNVIARRAGNVTGTETWSPVGGLPWLMLAGVNVDSPGHLVVNAGTRVLFGASQYLGVFGRVTAVGTEASPIVFTSSAASPTPGAWQYFQIQTGTNPASTLKWARIEYAPLSITQGTTPHIVEHVTITNPPAIGLTAANSTTTFRFLDVSGGSGAAVSVGGGAPAFHQSVFRGTGPAFVTAASTTVDATLCYWGSPTGPSGAGLPGSGLAVPAGVRYEPWLASSPVTAHYVDATTHTNRSFNATIGVNTTVDFTTVASGNWTLSFLDSLGTTVLKTFSGTGSPASATWNAQNTAGQLVPGGTYLWKLDTTGSATAAQVRGYTVFDPAKQLLVGIAATERYFSPDGDGSKDTTNVVASVNFENSSWTLRVKYAGNTVRTTSGGYPGPSFIWDGKNDSGQIQANGDYTAELTAANGSVTAVASTPLTLDVTDPAVTITSPAEGVTVSNIYQSGTSVIASATDPIFSGWSLEAGYGTAPTSFTAIGSGVTPLENSSIPWSSARLTPGPYTLRLKATDRAGNLATFDRHITKKDFSASQKGVLQFDPEVSAMTYESIIPDTLRETITIKNEAGQVVRTLVNDVQRTAATYNDAWNGRNDSGQRVPDGAYFYTATVTDGTATLAWPNPVKTDHGQHQIRIATSPNFDPFDNTPMSVSFELGMPQKLTLQASLSNPGVFGSNCNSLPSGTVCLESRYRPSGSHGFEWSGTKLDGTFVTGMRSLGVLADAFPENATVIFGSEPRISNVRFDPPLMSPAVGATLSFDLQLEPGATATAAVRLIRHETDAAVRTITQSVSGGLMVIPVDGLADNGLWIPPGPYTAEIKITDSIGNVVTRHAVMTARY